MSGDEDFAGLSPEERAERLTAAVRQLEQKRGQLYVLTVYCPFCETANDLGTEIIEHHMARVALATVPRFPEYLRCDSCDNGILRFDRWGAMYLVRKKKEPAA